MRFWYKASTPMKQRPSRLYASLVSLVLASSSSAASQGLERHAARREPHRWQHLALRSGHRRRDGTGADRTRHSPRGRGQPGWAAGADGRIRAERRSRPHVVVIDVAEGRRVGRIDLGPKSRPHSVVFMRDGRRAVVTLEQSDRIALVDVVDRRVLRTYPTGGREGHMVRLSPDGARAFVTSRGAEGTLSIISLPAMRRRSSFRPARAPKASP